jgi:G3E family GTPase
MRVQFRPARHRRSGRSSRRPHSPSEGSQGHGAASVQDLLDIRGFNLNAILEIEPEFLTDVAHQHDDDVTSFVFRETRPLDQQRMEEFLNGVLQVYGPSLLRYKGVLHIKGSERRVVLQGVHMLMGSDLGAPWKPGEARESKFVFIGRDMPREMLLTGLAACVACGPRPPGPRRASAA